MALGKRKNLWLMMLTLGLCSCGCTGGPSAGSKDRFLARNQNPGGPPALAPALYIAEAPQPALEKAIYQTLEVPPLVPPRPAPLKGEETGSTTNPLGHLYRQAARKAASMDSYFLWLRRREQVNGHKKPEEIILLKFRKEPFSVHLQWLGNEAKNREVIYVMGRYQNKMHTRVAAGDILLVPAGTRISLPPDSPLVKSNSRHPITEAGLENLVNQFGNLVLALEKGDTGFGTAAYLGLLKRAEFPNPVEAVRHVIPPKVDPLLPRGGQRQLFFDPQNHLPVLVITQDETGQEVEYYCHDRIEFPVQLNEDDFNPDKLWSKSPKS